MWRDYSQHGSKTSPAYGDILGQRVAADGSMVGSPMELVDGYQRDHLVLPKIGYSQAGQSYLLVWQEDDLIQGQRLNQAGQPTGNRVLIGSGGQQNRQPTVIGLADRAEFLVAWRKKEADGTITIVSQQVDAQGQL